MGTENDIKHSLKMLPDTLTAAYDEIYKRIQAQKGSAARLALNAFRWVKFSYEPLASQTLLDAVTMHVSNTGKLSKDGAVTSNTVLKICQNLLILDKQLDLLIDKGARIEAMDKDESYTALHIATSNGHEAVVNLLLDHGADIEATDKGECRTALHIAISEQHDAIVKLLLDHGADIEAKTDFGSTALLLAAQFINSGMSPRSPYAL
ncbi:ankyrin repeat-containing domain protein [Trichophaea hybrida]|nr:ankyrin repeat-containing domain protein [Trichophaea hybrida]